jgi:general stress protein 26
MTETVHQTPAEQTAKVAELIRDIKFAMLTTVDDQGSFISRPMAHQDVEFDGDLWFFSSRDSRKVEHIQANPHVGVVLASADTWVSINGSAETVEDDAKSTELWGPEMEAWFPGGREDPSVVLLKVNGESAEYWDTPGGRVSSVLSFVKAKATGKRYDGGENEQVDLSAAS